MLNNTRTPMMPTLMPSQQTQPVALPHLSASSVTAPAVITLSFEGTEFKLCPVNSDSEMSYKTKSDKVILSLSSFTGILTVSKMSDSSFLWSSSTKQASLDSESSNNTTVMTATASSKAPTVEDDPDSPEQHQKKSRHKISPGQQTLPFKSGNNYIKKQISKKDGSDMESNRKRRKDIAVVKVPQETNSKRSRHGIKTSLLPISLGQASQSTQLTQIDVGTHDYNDHSILGSTVETEKKPMNHPLIPTSSVQEILDRDCIQSSGDSIVTVRDSDDCIIGVSIDDGGIPATDEQDQEINDDILVMGNDADTKDVDAGSFSYPAPPARWGHTMTKVDNGHILVYGGQSFDLDGNPVILSDVHVYNPKNGGSWHKPINCRGEARQWHSATYIPGRQQIIAFGGETIDPISTNAKKGGKKGKVITSDTLRVLDTEIMLWYPPAASGAVPTGRSGHSATFFPSTNELIIFGGVRGSKWLNSVSILDVTRWIWTSPHIFGTGPKPRSYHTATAVGPQKMVVFGGNNKSSCFNTVHVLEAIGDDGRDSTCDGRSSNLIGGRNSSFGWKWSNPTIRGKAPFPRTGHTATLLEDGKTIIVYGGWDPNEEDELTGEDNIFKGSYLLDTNEWTWKKGPDPQSGGSGSSKHIVENCGANRCGHTAALNPENGEVFVFGGRIHGEVLAGDVQRVVTSQEKTLELEGCVR